MCGFVLPWTLALPKSGRARQSCEQLGADQHEEAGADVSTGSYLHQAALRTHPGHHPGPPGRLPAPSLAPPTCSQTTSLTKNQQTAQPRAPTSQKLPPSLQTMSLGGSALSLLPTQEAGVTPKQQSQALSEREHRWQHGRITAECYLNVRFPPHKKWERL